MGIQMHTVWTQRDLFTFLQDVKTNVIFISTFMDVLWGGTITETTSLCTVDSLKQRTHWMWSWSSLKCSHMRTMTGVGTTGDTSEIRRIMDTPPSLVYR